MINKILKLEMKDATIYEMIKMMMKIVRND